MLVAVLLVVGVGVSTAFPSALLSSRPMMSHQQPIYQARSVSLKITTPRRNDHHHSRDTTPHRPWHIERVRRHASTDHNNDDTTTTTTTETTNPDSTTTSSNTIHTVVPKVMVEVDESEHDSAVMNRLLRPYQYFDLIQTIVFRSVLLMVTLGFGLQFFGYSYIVEYDNDIVVTTTTTNDQGVVVTTSKVQHTQPPKFRIGTMEERDFIQEIRKDMKQ